MKLIRKITVVIITTILFAVSVLDNMPSLSVLAGEGYGDIITITSLSQVYESKTTETEPYKIIQYTAVGNGSFTFYCSNSNSSNWDSYGYLYDNLDMAVRNISSAMSKINSDGMSSITVHLSECLTEDDINGEGKNPAITYNLEKGKTYYFVMAPYSNGYGDFGIKILCNHSTTHLENKTISSCVEGGYTGDEVCDICGEIVKRGSEIDEDSEHDYIVKEHTDADCQNYGKTIYVCKNCDISYSVIDEEGGYGDHVYVTKNYKKPTCNQTGYSGDQVCRVCGKTVEGHILEKTTHKASDVLQNKINATCYTDGYSGDECCINCEDIMSAGQKISKFSHDYVNNVCIRCGRIINAKLGETYSSKTTKELPFQVIEYTADMTGEFLFYCANIGETWDSYGYLYEKNNNPDEIIGNAIVKYRSSNDTNDLRLSNYLVSNDDGGEGRHSMVAYQLTKGETYCFVIGPYAQAYGQFSLTIKCSHASTHIVGKSISTCISGGYTGDVVCDVCGEIVEKGTSVPPGSNHSYKVISHADANCIHYDTTVYKCEYCGDTYSFEDTNAGLGEHDYKLVNQVNATCTKDGYTGDVTCSVCGDVQQQGSIVKSTGHHFVNGVCDICGVPEEFLSKDAEGYYQIYTASDFAKYIERGSDGNDMKLMNDIDMSAYCAANQWPSVIGKNIIIEGNNHKITGLNIIGGIFSQLNNSSVRNLTLSGTVNGTDYTGTIAGKATSSTIQGCINNCNVTGKDYVGGLTGYSLDCTFTDVTNHGKISGVNYVGGITGFDSSSLITRASNDNYATATEKHAGVLAGDYTGTQFVDCEQYHVHNYVYDSTTRATLSSDGRYTYKCDCGVTKYTTIPHISTISISKNQYTYNGNNISLPTVSIKDRNGKTIEQKYYKISYTDSNGHDISAIKYPGKYYVKVVFSGIYDGTKTLDINVSMSQISTAKISNAKNIKGKKITIKWKKAMYATGYQIKFANNKKFKKAKTYKVSAKVLKKTFKKLKKKKTYYFRVRVITYINGVTYSGNWSKIKKVRVKK